MKALEDTGLSLDEMAVTASRVYCLSLDQDSDGEVHPAWGPVAQHVVALTESGDDDINLSVTQLAALLRKEFARAADSDGEGLAEFATLELKVQNAWRAVARHLLNVMTGEERVLKDLNRQEQMMADFAKANFVRS